MTGLEKPLDKNGMFSNEELFERKILADIPKDLTKKIIKTELVMQVIEAGGPVKLDSGILSGFSFGEKDLAKNRHPNGHTRELVYLRVLVGTINEHHGCHVFPDQKPLSKRLGGNLYSARFETEQLWGSDSNFGGTVYVDLWELYLEDM